MRPLFALVGLVLALGAAPAQAATVRIVDGTLTYVAATGELNEVAVEVGGGEYTLRPMSDPPAPITADAPCIGFAGTAVCPVAPVTAMSFTLGDGNDQALVTPVVGSDAQRVLVPVRIDGGTGDDTLAGGFADDVLEGGPGDDTLTKGWIWGDVTVPPEGDVLRGGEGTDTVSYNGAVYGDDVRGVTVTLDGLANDGRSGAHDLVADDVERLIGSGGADTLTGSARADRIDGGFGPDLVFGGAGDDVLDGYFLNGTGGGYGGDTLDGGPGNDRLSNAYREHGGTGNDVLMQSVGDAGAGYLHGDDGDDRLLPTAGPGPDVIAGDAGIDTADYARTWFGVDVSLDGIANDSGEDDVSAEILIGGDGPDRLTGGLGPDTIHGANGKDIIDGGPGTDTYTGGDDYDTVSYASRGTGVHVTFDGLANDGVEGENENAEGAGDIESVQGSPGDDVLTGSPRADYLVGGEGDDELDGGLGADSLDGGPGDDALDGAADRDWLTGGKGQDEILGGPGEDTLAGGLGNDRLSGGDDADRDSLNGGEFPPSPIPVDDGLDVADFSWRTEAIDATLPSILYMGTSVAGDGLASVEGLIGGSGPDVLTGNHLQNVLIGGPGDDRLLGEESEDLLVGGDGSDQLTGGGGNDTLNGSAGEDTARYDSSFFVEVTLDGAANDGGANEYDNVGPLGDVENVVGSYGDDLLIGDAGANRLDGGWGNDVLLGAGGADRLTGGGSYDVAAYVERTDAVSLILDGTPRSGGPADGPPGARDAIDADVEGLWGGDGDDTLTGNAADNLLNGGPGGDVLGGGPGTDAADYSDRSQPVDVTIDGQSRSGGAADGHRDTVLTDVEDVIGGTAADRLSGSPAVNLLLGLGGDDTLTTRDDVSDTPECGAGNDTAVVDRFDEPEECEDVQLPVTPRATPTPTPTATPVTTPTPTTTPTVPAARVALARGQTLAGALRRGLRTQVTCGAACTVDQRLVIARSTARRLGLPAKRPLTIARATATAKGPTTLKLTLRVEARVARRLRSARSLTATLATTVRMPGARTPQLSTTVRLSGRRTAQADRLLAMRDASRAWTRRAERR